MLKKIISISLIILLITSHLGIAVGTHYCGGLAVETRAMIGHQHMDCGMGDMDSDCEGTDSETRFDKLPCCQNEYLSVPVEDEFKPVLDQSKINVDFISAFVVTYLELFSDRFETQFIQYDPPLVTRDISTLLQVFLI